MRVLGAVVKSVERRPREREIGSSVLGRVKPVTYKKKYLSLPGLLLDINSIWQGLVNSVSGYRYHGADGLIAHYDKSVPVLLTSDGAGT